MRSAPNSTMRASWQKPKHASWKRHRDTFKPRLKNFAQPSKFISAISTQPAHAWPNKLPLDNKPSLKVQSLALKKPNSRKQFARLAKAPPNKKSASRNRKRDF